MIIFKHFGIEDNEKYLSYLKKCSQILSDASPITFLNLKERYKIYRGYAENFCWHKLIFQGNEFFLVPLGDWDNADWKRIFTENIPHGARFTFIPENLVKIWKKIFGDGIEFAELRDYRDYILDLEKIYKLQGQKLKHFRNEKNFFEKHFDYEVEEITPKIFDELFQFQFQVGENLKNRINRKIFVEEENKNFKFALDNWNKFNLFGFVVRVDKKIVAYIINNEISEKYLIGLFAKADYNFKGANQFAYWYDAKKNLERGFFEINIMDDAGEENLRFFKEHLQPKSMLRKFFVIYK